MLIAKLKTAATLLLGLALLGGAAAGLTYPGRAGPGEPASGEKVTGAPSEVGDRATDGLRQALPAAQDLGGVMLRGVVTRTDPIDSIVLISLDADDGIRKGQVLDVYRLHPKAVYLGQVRVIDASYRFCVARLTAPGASNKIEVGDLVTDSLPGAAPNTGPAGEAGDRENKGTTPAGLRGVVNRIDGTNNLLEISRGSDDGIKESQVLHAYQAMPKGIYLGPIKVLATFRRSSVARPLDRATGMRMSAGDVVTDAPPQPQRGDGTVGVPGPGPGGVGDAAAALSLSARQTAELFLAAAHAGKQDAARAIALPSLPKRAIEEVKNLAKPVPPLVLIFEDTAEALAISETVEAAIGKETRKGRFMVLLKRAAPQGGEFEGWIAHPWRVADASACAADETLPELIDFLRRHPNARHAPDQKQAGH